MRKNVLIYGLQRSGTNYLEHMLKKYCQLKILNDNYRPDRILHKHFRLYNSKNIVPEPAYKNDVCIDSYRDFKKGLEIEVQDCAIVVISKNPYSWLLSYRRWARKCEWPAVEHNYLQEYNLFYEKWIQMAKETDNISIIKYIDLLKDPDSMINILSEAHQLARRNKLDLVLRRLNSDSKVKQSEKFDNRKKNYYMNAEYIEEFTNEEIESINGIIDKDLMRKLGYRIYKPGIYRRQKEN